MKSKVGQNLDGSKRRKNSFMVASSCQYMLGEGNSLISGLHHIQVSLALLKINKKGTREGKRRREIHVVADE